MNLLKLTLDILIYNFFIYQILQSQFIYIWSAEVDKESDSKQDGHCLLYLFFWTFAILMEVPAEKSRKHLWTEF